MSELRPCPFCGSIAEERRDDDCGFYCICTNYDSCGIKTDFYVNKKYAVAAWNTRPDGWISTKERLPDGEYDVLVFCTNGFIYTDNFSQGGGWAMVSGVTHWMPLPPAPPKEKEE